MVWETVPDMCGTSRIRRAPKPESGGVGIQPFNSYLLFCRPARWSTLWEYGTKKLAISWQSWPLRAKTTLRSCLDPSRFEASRFRARHWLSSRPPLSILTPENIGRPPAQTLDDGEF